MNGLSRKLHEMNKTSVIPEPTEAHMLISDQNELQLHRTALQILECHKNDIEGFINNLDGPACPELSEADNAIVEASQRLIFKRYMLLIQRFEEAFICLGNKTAEFIFWTRFGWFMRETTRYAEQAIAEENVLGSPDFFKLCMGEQDEKLKPVYDKWDKTLFSEESFKQYVEETISNHPLPALSPEEEERLEREAERQEQEDNEFDEKVFREKCPACPKQCDWFKREKEKRMNGGG